MEKLNLVSTEDIVDELATRYDGVVLLLHRSIDSDNEDDDGYYRGGATKAIGMMKLAIHNILYKHGKLEKTEDE